MGRWCPSPTACQQECGICSQHHATTAVSSDAILWPPRDPTGKLNRNQERRRETTGYDVANLNATLAKAEAVGATVLRGPYSSSDRDSAIMQFPGGYIAEIHNIK
jgi:hypothetical protein